MAGDFEMKINQLTLPHIPPKMNIQRDTICDKLNNIHKYKLNTGCVPCIRVNNKLQTVTYLQ